MIPRDRYSVVVAGGGIGGLCAALRAQEEGASVAIVEKAGSSGGAAAESGGTLWCAADLDEWFKAQPGGDAELGTALIEGFRAGLEWLPEQGVPVERVEEPRPFRFRRVLHQMMPDARTAMQALERRFVSRGGAIFTDAALTGILGGKGSPVTGVTTAGDGLNELEGRSVILATGGFQGSAELRAKHFGAESDRMIVRTVPQNTGGGLRSALEAGARPVGPFDRFYGHFLPAPPAEVGMHNFLAVKPDFSEYTVLVNLKGERFDDEYLGDHINCHALVRQPGATGVLIFDQYVRDNQDALSQWPTGSERIASIRAAGGEVVESSSEDGLVRALAERWRIASEPLRRTLAEHAAACAAGHGRGLSVPRSGGLVPLAVPPYYAVRVLPGITFTYGGAKVDAGARVLGGDDAPIAGLYAAGADCGGVYTLGYTGGLAMGLAFGLIAGEGAAMYARAAPDPGRRDGNERRSEPGGRPTDRQGGDSQ